MRNYFDRNVSDISHSVSNIETIVQKQNVYIELEVESMYDELNRQDYTDASAFSSNIRSSVKGCISQHFGDDIFDLAMSIATPQKTGNNKVSAITYKLTFNAKENREIPVDYKDPDSSKSKIFKQSLETYIENYMQDELGKDLNVACIGWGTSSVHVKLAFFHASGVKMTLSDIFAVHNLLQVAAEGFKHDDLQYTTMSDKTYIIGVTLLFSFADPTTRLKIKEKFSLIESSIRTMYLENMSGKMFYNIL